MRESFESQYHELAKEVMATVQGYPEITAICVISAVGAALLKAMGKPKEVFIAMIESAFEDMEKGG